MRGNINEDAFKELVVLQHLYVWGIGTFAPNVRIIWFSDYNYFRFNLVFKLRYCSIFYFSLPVLWKVINKDKKGLLRPVDRL